MNIVEGKRVVVISLFATGAVVLISKTIKGGGFPTDPRLYIAAAFIFIVLGFAVDFAPQVAGPLAVLVFVAVLLAEGGPVLDAVTAINRGAKPAKKGKGDK